MFLIIDNSILQYPMETNSQFKESMDQKVNQIVQDFLGNHTNYGNLQKKKQWMKRALWKVLDKTSKIVELDIEQSRSADKEYIQVEYEGHPSPIQSSEKQRFSKSSASKQNDHEQKSSDLLEMAKLSDNYQKKIANKYDQSHGNSFQIFKGIDQYENYKLIFEDLENHVSSNENKYGTINFNQFLSQSKIQKQRQLKPLKIQNELKRIISADELFLAPKSQRECKKRILNLRDIESSSEAHNIKIQEDSSFLIVQENIQKSQTIYYQVAQLRKSAKFSFKKQHRSQNKKHPLKYHKKNKFQRNYLKRQYESEGQIFQSQFSQENMMAHQQPRNQQRMFKYSNKGRKPEFPQMQKKLCKWIRKQINEEKRVTQAEIRGKAVQIMKSCKMYDGKMFRASKGWMEKFFRRHTKLFQFISKRNFKREKVFCGKQKKVLANIYSEDDQ